MKYLFILFTLFVGVSCGVKVPFTEDIKKEYSLDDAENMKKVQFYTSTTIVLEKSILRGSKAKTEDGTLVTSKNKIQDRIIIPVNTKCIFDSYDANGNVNIRFELGSGKTIKFGIRENQVTGRYYFIASNWDYEKGGEVQYGGDTYYATSNSGNAFLLVVIKKLQKTRRKDRVVKGLKV
jgi:hypothetical protein